MTDKSNFPVLLIILDGWGIGQDYAGNAVLAARTPVLDNLRETYPTTSLKTSGLAVGLPEGQMGNSEVGHLNIGAGFVVYQWITRIDRSIEDRSFFENKVLTRSMDQALASGKKLHLIGLIGEGGVHAHTRHLKAVLDLAASRGLKRVFIHAITDGRDTSPTSGNGFVRDVQDHCQRLGIGRVATISGRYYAMDRDQRWDRTQLAYDAMTSGTGPVFTSASAAIEAAYREGVTDEFIIPCAIVPPGAQPATIDPEDSVIFFNFRSDRCRQLVQALSLPNFSGFQRSVDLSPTIRVATMTRYQEGLPVEVAFEPHDVEMPLSRVISDAGLTQFHTAETEKYAHVTFFLNGGREDPYPGEVRSLVPSPRVATYDLQPSMSAPAVTDGVIDAIESGDYAFVVVNFANGDMVGHTGVFDAAVEAIETVDSCVGRILDALAAHGGIALITADHGNSEEMIDLTTGGPMTAHTLNPVPLILVTPESSPFRRAILRQDGVLANIAPTIVQLMGLSRPPQMTEPSLIES